MNRCDAGKCGYRSPHCPDCCGVVEDSECALFYLCCVHTTGLRFVEGCKVTTLETCCRGGGYCLCCASACALPPDEKVPLGCGCCGFGLGFEKPMALEGTGLEWTDNETCCHYVCGCCHGAIFKQVSSIYSSLSSSRLELPSPFFYYHQFPRCCGGHSLSTCCCFAQVCHCGLDPVDQCCKSRSQQCCVDSNRTLCPRPCWPYCMFADEPCCL